MYRPILVTPPATTPVSLAEVKAHLVVESTVHDTLINSVIAAATTHLDGWTGILGLALVSQTWRQDFDRFARCLRLPLYPVISITSVKYDDADDVEQTITGANYDLLTDDLGSYVKFKDTFSFPTLHTELPAVRITYVAGYGDADAVPAAIKHAMLLLIGAWYKNREETAVGVSVSALPRSVAVDALLTPYRRVQF